MSDTDNNASIWVIVAAFNEQQVIAKTLDGLVTEGYTVVVVDDGSTDGTYETARTRAVHALRHYLNFGQGSALETGRQYALEHGARYICTFDADGQHRAQDIHTMYTELVRSGADIAIGSRFLGETSGMPSARRFVLKAGVLFHRIFYRIALSDAHNGLRLMTRDAARFLKITQPGMAHATEIIKLVKKHGLKFIEVPVTVIYTEYSRHKGQKSRSLVTTLKDLLIGGMYK